MQANTTTAPSSFRRVGLAAEVQAIIERAYRRGLEEAVERIEAEIDRHYPPERFRDLLDERMDWPELRKRRR